MLFAQVQAFLPVLIALIQAGVLISIYEYACGRLQAAYTSIGVCTRMYAIGKQNFEAMAWQEDTEACLKLDKTSLWWAIVICERIFFCEFMPPDQPPASKFPGKDDPLPSEMELLSKIHATNIGSMTSPPVSPVPPDSVGGFGRVAQAAQLLDQVRSAIRIVDTEDRQAKLLRLDVELQSFLGMVMAQSSRAAPDTVTKIMTDIAYSHNKNLTDSNVDVLPVTSFYVLRAALKHLGANRRHKDDEIWFLGSEALRNMAGHFKSRWAIEEMWLETKNLMPRPK
ncbi:MAG: hypothetical protein M1834_005621 [Cirrosporium novae-zelandiae]|nr:MAG: hypothetical protein M1834_005621 [Cirrosporium novae-zelandiae]